MPAVGTTGTILRLAPQYAFFALLKRRVSLQRLAHVAWREPRATPRTTAIRQPREEARIIACIVRLHRLLGGRDDDCVPRSLLLYRELSRLGANPKLCVGFKSAEAELLGHAWVEVDGRMVGETDPGPAGFSKQLTFGGKGEVD